MNLPTLPTDNLYKFLAIFGLVILVATNAIFFIVGSSLINQSTDLLQNVAVSTFDQKAVSADIAETQNMLNNLYKNLSSASPGNQLAIINQIAKEQGRIEKDNGQLMEIANNITKFNNSLGIINWIRFEEICLVGFFAVGNIGGILISIISFRLWYTKLQKYQDKIVKNKAN